VNFSPCFLPVVNYLFAMLIWLLAIVVFGLVGALGYYQGAIRLLVSLAGLLVAALLAFPLAPMTKFLVPLIGIKTVFWSWALPPLVNFCVLYLVGIGVAFFAHHKVALHYKYRTEDMVRLRWERLNERLGICVGLASGGVWMILLSLGIYIAGYPTVQLSNEDNATGMFRFLNMARRDLESTGLARTAARFDSTPATYYQASDILGLIYNNPILLNRLAQYPPFLLTGNRPELQEIANDKDYMSMLLSKTDIAQILANPKTQVVINNVEFLDEMERQDLKDLGTYLQTGKSPKYDDEKILGRWQIDLYATVAQEKKKNPDMTASEMQKLKKQAGLMSNISFVATTDNKAILKVELTEQQQKILQAAQAPAVVAPAEPAGQPTMSPDLARRYGIGPGGRRTSPGGQQVRPAAPKPATPSLVQPVFSAQGTWKHTDDKYEVALQDEKGKQQTGNVVAEDGRLIIHLPTKTLVLARVE
jgi:hypothetical protein